MAPRSENAPPYNGYYQDDRRHLEDALALADELLAKDGNGPMSEMLNDSKITFARALEEMNMAN